MACPTICFANPLTTQTRLLGLSPCRLISHRTKRSPAVPFRRRPSCVSIRMAQDLLLTSDDGGRSHLYDTAHVWRSTETENWLELSSDDSSATSFNLDSVGGDKGFNDAGGPRGGGGGGSFNNDDPGADESGDGLPDDIKRALAYGSIEQSDVQRYLKAIRNPFLRLFFSIPGFRTRFVADSAFCFKLLVQEAVGNGTALASEIAVRGKEIVDEVEYVASDLIVGTVIEAAFVWLLAPTMRLPAAANASGLSKYLAALPSNLFQPSTAIISFTATQRIVSFLYAAVQYAAVGLGGGIVGTAITYSLLEARKLIDSSYKPLRPMPPVIPNSLGWAAFMGLSSNTRFQLVEGLELGVARLFTAYSHSLVNSTIFVLRLINNYWGGVQFVRFFRAIGLHATGEEEHTTGDQIFNLSP